MAQKVSVCFNKRPNYPFPPVGRFDLGLKLDSTLGNFSFRCRHDFEKLENEAVLDSNGNVIRYGKPRQLISGFEQKRPMPQTVPSFPRNIHDPEGRIEEFVPFTRAWQERTWQLIDWASGYRLARGEILSYFKIINGRRQESFMQDSFARVECTPHSLLYVWEDTYRDSVALTDNYSYDDGYADYILGRNLGAPPVKRKCLFFGGQPLNVLGYESNYVVVEAFDPVSPPPSLEWILENKPHLIGITNEIGCLEHQKLPDGRWVVAKWGKFEAAAAAMGFEAMGVPYFIFGWGGRTRVRKSDVIPLHSTRYSMYVP